VEAHHPPDVATDDVVTAVDEEIDRLAADGLEPGELARVQARIGSSLVQGQDHILGRTLAWLSSSSNVTEPSWSATCRLCSARSARRPYAAQHSSCSRIVERARPQVGVQ
jgi:hypothetical protein